MGRQIIQRRAKDSCKGRTTAFALTWRNTKVKWEVDGGTVKRSPLCHYPPLRQGSNGKLRCDYLASS